MNTFSSGVVILEIRRASTAQRLGFQPHDIIARINGSRVKTVRQSRQFLSEEPSRWIISIKRDGKVLSVTVKP